MYVRPDTFGRPSIRRRLRLRRQTHRHILFILYTVIAAIFNNKYNIILVFQVQ